MVEDAEALRLRAAEEIVRAVARAISEKGRCTLCLAGGTTPAGAYETIAAHHAGALDWSRVDFFWNDERCVPPDDPSSNFGLAQRTLLSRLGPCSDRVHRMRGEIAPQEGARDYEVRLARVFTGLPRFDLLLLGLGDDAHIASLFPGHPALEERQRWVLPVEVEAPVRHRLTLTSPVLNNAARILFLVSGEKKAAAVRSVLGGQRDARTFPAQLIGPSDGHVTWLIDRAAEPRGLAL